jgi:glutamyl-Q tRNA(Asp) synthetase
MGHAYAALFAERAAGQGGTFLLRIEDIDPTRCREEYTQAIYEDLGWLGIVWPQPVRVQSRHMADYAAAFERLRDMGLVYPCFCTRREIEQEAARAGGAPHADEAGFVYPGTCRCLSSADVADRLARQDRVSWRLNVGEAMRRTGALTWHDRVRGDIAARPDLFGDVVLARKDMPTSYHLSVVVDDHLQGVDLVTRGVDLFDTTHIHRLLQALLGYRTPDYHHHRLLCDETGKRFAKRDKSVTLRALRQGGVSADEVRRKIYLSLNSENGQESPHGNVVLPRT